MAGASSNAIYGDLKALFETGTLAGWTDRQLLERFTHGSGKAAESAFAVLVDRHGPTVWRVCKQSLGNMHDAEDAFQATFVVLARRATRIRRAESLGSWLHGVALRASSCVRRTEARRRRQEGDAVVGDESYCVDETRDDTFRAVHEEVARLPVKIREAVVLCYFEGLTHDQTASRLGCPIGTVHSRLAWAKDRLAARLQRRHVTPSVVLLRVLDGSRFDAPLGVMARTVQAAVGGSGGQAHVLTPLVAAVIHETTRITMMSKISLVMVGLATTLLVVVASDPGVAAAPQEPGVRPKSATRTSGAPGDVEVAPASVAKAPTTLVAEPRIPASTRVLLAKLEGALAVQVSMERLERTAVIGHEEADKARREVALVVAEIESQRDGVADEVELLEAQLGIARAELEGATEIQRHAEAGFKQAQTSSLELNQRSAQVKIKQAELRLVEVRLRQAKRRLGAFDGLIKKVETMNKPPMVPDSR